MGPPVRRRGRVDKMGFFGYSMWLGHPARFTRFPWVCVKVCALHSVGAARSTSTTKEGNMLSDDAGIIPTPLRRLNAALSKSNVSADRIRRATLILEGEDVPVDPDVCQLSVPLSEVHKTAVRPNGDLIVMGSSSETQRLYRYRGLMMKPEVLAEGTINVVDVNGDEKNPGFWVVNRRGVHFVYDDFKIALTDIFPDADRFLYGVHLYEHDGKRQFLFKNIVGDAVCVFSVQGSKVQHRYVITVDRGIQIHASVNGRVVINGVSADAEGFLMIGSRKTSFDQCERVLEGTMHVDEYGHVACCFVRMHSSGCVVSVLNDRSECVKLCQFDDVSRPVSAKYLPGRNELLVASNHMLHTFAVKGYHLKHTYRFDSGADITGQSLKEASELSDGCLVMTSRDGASTYVFDAKGVMNNYGRKQPEFFVSGSHVLEYHKDLDHYGVFDPQKSLINAERMIPASRMKPKHLFPVDGGYVGVRVLGHSSRTHSTLLIRRIDVEE